MPLLQGFVELAYPAIHLPQVRALGFDDRFIRMWEYYLAICEASFLERNTGNVQLVLAKARTGKRLWGEPAGEEAAGEQVRKEISSWAAR